MDDGRAENDYYRKSEEAHSKQTAWQTGLQKFPDSFSRDEEIEDQVGCQKIKKTDYRRSVSDHWAVTDRVFDPGGHAASISKKDDLSVTELEEYLFSASDEIMSDGLSSTFLLELNSHSYIYIRSKFTNENNFPKIFLNLVNQVEPKVNGGKAPCRGRQTEQSSEKHNLGE